MAVLKETWPIAGTRQATGRTGTSLLAFDAYLTLAHDADVHRCVQFFVNDSHAPCYNLLARRTYALAAFYVAELMHECGPGCRFQFELLVLFLCSGLRTRHHTAVRIIRTLLDIGLLEVEDSAEVTSWPE